MMDAEERWEYIYDRINGMNEPDPNERGRIKNEVSVGGVIGPLVEQAYDARDRLCDRFGVEPDDDPDLERLIDGFEGLSRVCGKLMYYYGYQDGVKQERRRRR